METSAAPPEPTLEPLRPLLKWAGGKSHLVPRLRELYAPHRYRRLVEPFTGGLAISLGLLPEKALLADINPHIINFYREVSRGLEVVLEMENSSECYYESRRRFNALLQEGKSEGAEQASLFYYLNRTCYNGLCRFNLKGGFNVPFGRHKTLHYLRDFGNYVPILSRWEFVVSDFQQIPLDPEDFLYLDPPYDVEFTKFAKDDFTWEDQVRLAQWASKHPGPVIASNQATDRILKLYLSLGFQISVISAPRKIACNGDRTPAAEIVATRNL